MNQIKILDVKINNVTMDEVLKYISNCILDGKPHQIVTANPEILVNCQKDPEAKDILNQTDLVIADGIGLLWAAKTTNQQLSQRVTGVDLIEHLAELAAQKKYSIFFLGAQEGVSQKTANILCHKYPALKIAGYSSVSADFSPDCLPQYKFPFNVRQTDIKATKTDPNLKIVNLIRQTKPDILLVAYGHPKQELFISRYKKLLNVPVMIGVGGAFDFISGKALRAPMFLQKMGWELLGFEWLWRFLTQPWRLKRIITAVIIFPWLVFVHHLQSKQ